MHLISSNTNSTDSTGILRSNRKLATLAIHPKGFHEHDPVTGAVIPPISLSTTFAQREPSHPIGVKLSLIKKFSFSIILKLGI